MKAVERRCKLVQAKQLQRLNISMYSRAVKLGAERFLSKTNSNADKNILADRVQLRVNPMSTSPKVASPMIVSSATRWYGNPSSKTVLLYVQHAIETSAILAYGLSYSVTVVLWFEVCDNH